jgi:hypothetical protein
MGLRMVAAAAFLLSTSPPLSAQQVPSDNKEMSAIFAADQAPRSSTGATVNWAIVGPEDEVRRARTKALLDTGRLTTGADFYHAATVFQHGTTAADYMLAHTLAVAALARGRSDAAWMAAATLDRYLQAVGHAQIYGTQFKTPDRKNTTQEPYDRALISDALRESLNVPTLAEQEIRRRAIQESYRAAVRP